MAYLPSIEMAMRAVCRVSRNSETSLIARLSRVLPLRVVATMRSGLSSIDCARLSSAVSPEVR